MTRRAENDPGPAGFVVRPARPRDAASFLEMWRVVVDEGRFVRNDEIRLSARGYRRAFRSSWTSDRVQLVAVSGDRVIGQASGWRETSVITRHVATLGIAVVPDRRGQGVGTALMDRLITWARSVGVEKLELSVYPDNAVARAMYRRFGFEEEGRLSGHSKKAIGYRDEILMGRWLIERPAAPT